jgi:hypothetical protein
LLVSCRSGRVRPGAQRREGEGRLVAHYVLAVYCGHWASGEPLARSDVAAARFVAIADLGAYNLTPGASSLINRARAMAG